MSNLTCTQKQYFHLADILQLQTKMLNKFYNRYYCDSSTVSLVGISHPSLERGEMYKIYLHFTSTTTLDGQQVCLDFTKRPMMDIINMLKGLDYVKDLTHLSQILPSIAPRKAIHYVKLIYSSDSYMEVPSYQHMKNLQDVLELLVPLWLLEDPSLNIDIEISYNGEEANVPVHQIIGSDYWRLRRAYKVSWVERNKLPEPVQDNL